MMMMVVMVVVLAAVPMPTAPGVRVRAARITAGADEHDGRSGDDPDDGQHPRCGRSCWWLCHGCVHFTPTSMAMTMTMTRMRMVMQR